MRSLKILALLLVLALSVQNTCPHGLAAKTGFASPHTHCCCAKKAAEHSKTSDKTSKQVLSVTGPAFVFIGRESAMPLIAGFG
jgi:hypothetical protein